MNKYSIKAAACALVGTLSLSGYQTTLEAKLNNTSDVPAAGVAVVLDESSTIQDLQVEVVQNIAYLESASGLQPNIVTASEKVALAEAPSSVVMSNTKKATAKVSTEFVQELSEAVSETELLAADEEGIPLCCRRTSAQSPTWHGTPRGRRCSTDVPPPPAWRWPLWRRRWRRSSGYRRPH